MHDTKSWRNMWGVFGVIILRGQSCHELYRNIPLMESREQWLKLWIDVMLWCGAGAQRMWWLWWEAALISEMTADNSRQRNSFQVWQRRCDWFTEVVAKSDWLNWRVNELIEKRERKERERVNKQSRHEDSLRDWTFAKLHLLNLSQPSRIISVLQKFYTL